MVYKNVAKIDHVVLFYYRLILSHIFLDKIFKREFERPLVPACKQKDQRPEHKPRGAYMVENSSVPVASSTLSAFANATADKSRIVTNDIYLAAFLLSKACPLVDVLRNGGRRLSFVFEGEDVEALRETYKAGSVCSFRDGLNRVREILHEQQRSVAHVSLQPGRDRASQE
jgi:hypothetical protein